MTTPQHGPTTSSSVSVRELLARGERSISVEFFPPKDDDGEALLWQTIRQLEPIAPDFVSVTYGAGGSTRDRTTRITAAIALETTLTPVAHLTCVGTSVTELRHIIGSYADGGVSTVLALRGDPAAGPGSPWVSHPDGLDRAVDLVRLIKNLSRFSVGVAAFPDGHPESPSPDVDARVLAEKADAGAEFAVTQFFFDPASYFRLVERVQGLGCDLPIIAGIMPVTNIGQVKRFAELSGAPMPTSIVRRLEAVAHDPAAVRAVGVELASELCTSLLDGGAPGLHFFALNRPTATLQILAELRLARHTPALL